MSPRLNSVLSGLDLPPAELYAARLDGEVFRLGECFSPIDEIEQPEHRARAVHSALGDPAATHGRAREKIIAEQRSAAWIWGATETVPTRQQLCVDTDSRVSRDHPRSVIVREVVIDADEFVLIGGFRVTTPVRTILDLARFSEDFTLADQRMVGTLMEMFNIPFTTCTAELDRRRNLPGKRRARERLSRC